MKTFIRSIATLHLVCIFLCCLFASTMAWASVGNIDSTEKYAWSENAGWLNHRPTNGGITVHGTYLSGYAWAENIGWIKLGSGTGPYDNNSSTNWGVNRNSGTGALSGYGWSENAGWINFNPTNSQVIIDTTTGSFEGYAWAENGGWIHFKNSSPAYNVKVAAIAPGTYYVNIGSGNDSNDGSSDDQAWKTLHHAIFQINGGSAGTYTLNVALGTYSKTNGEEDTGLTLSQSNVSVIGASGSGPIIDGTGAGTWTKGLEITGSNVTINNLYITNFSYGIKIDGCSPEISRNTIYDNEFNIGISAGSPIIKNNLIYEATSGVVSFGISIGGSGTVSPKIYHNTIDGGTYDGIYMDGTGNTPDIKYNIITGFGQYGIENYNGVGNPVIDYNDVWNNTSGNYSDCTAGANDISLDPKYGSYTLLGTSPCINAIPTADPPNDPVTDDIDETARPYGSGYDMGCYENTTLPAVTTTAASSITTTTASSGGNVTSEGGASVTARGVCWSTSANPTTSDSKTTDGTGTGTFTSSITGLSPGTTYYVRAYATNTSGTSYGSEVTFTTSSVTTPTVTTTAASSITTTTASSGGNVTSEGGASVTARGACWSTSANPTVSLPTKTTDGTGTGTFTSSITGLSPGTTYYVRAYATNPAGTSYGDQVSFDTLSIPTITSFSPTSGGTNTSVIITGTNFTGATAVKFGGTDASSFTVNFSTQITAIVAGGSTGTITVTTPGGTATSSDSFTYGAVTAGTYYVDIASGNDSNAGTAAAPWKTLHYAIDQINGGDAGTSALPYALIMAAGTYSTGNGEADTAITLSQSNVTIFGVDDHTIGASNTTTLIDGTDATTWTKGIEVTGSNVTINGISITKFLATGGYGIEISGISSVTTGNEVGNCKIFNNDTGIEITSSNAFKIRGCEIYSNTTDGLNVTSSTDGEIFRNTIYLHQGNGDDGLAVFNCSPAIKRNKIYDNDTGIRVEANASGASASPDIGNNVIYETTDYDMNYGILVKADTSSTASPTIYHNSIDGGSGDGIATENISTGGTLAPVIKYNIITRNDVHGIDAVANTCVINYNDVWHNGPTHTGTKAENYNNCDPGANDLYGVTPGDGLGKDPENGTAGPLAPTSPCINAIPTNVGDDAIMDYLGYKRPKGSGYDMGAYEYVAQQTYPYTLPGGTGAVTDYRIFTIPLDIGTGLDMLKTMEGTLGTYNQATWRVFAYTTNGDVEINTDAFAALDIKPGKGFWGITVLTDTISFQGTLAPDAIYYKIELAPGWHLFAVPWPNTSIELGKIYVTDGVNEYTITNASNTLTEQKIWDYTGSGPDSGYIQRVADDFSLADGTGYFIKVLGSSNIILSIPPDNNSDPPNNSSVSTLHAVPYEPVESVRLLDDSEPPPLLDGSYGPMPDIKANGTSGPLTVSHGTPVSITVSLDPGNRPVKKADWWVVAHTPFLPPNNWYSYVYPKGWQPGIHVCVQMPPFQLARPFEVLNVALPVGDYTIYFAVDENADGIVDETWVDSVDVRVE